jgi:hypothetical protein
MTYPSGNYLVFDTKAKYNSTINWTVTDESTGINTCWANLTGIYEYHNCYVNYSNLTNYNYNTPYSIVLFANDSAGNIKNATTTFNKYSYLYNHHSNKNAVGEGASVVFSLYVNATDISTNYPLSTASLMINNEVYAGSADLSNANYILFTKTLTIPDYYGNDTGNLTAFNWTYNISSAAVLTSAYGTTDTKNITVYNLGIDNCTAFGYNFINFTIKDEELNTELVNTDLLKVDVIISSMFDASIQYVYNGTYLNYSTVSLCIPEHLVDNTNYTIEVVAEYSADTYSKEFWFLDNGVLSKFCYFNNYTSCNVNLMDLLAADTTSFLFDYTDVDGSEVPEAIIHTYRKYIGENLYREVQRSKQDDNGETNVYLVEEEVLYYFMVTLEGEILYTSSETTAKCLSTPCKISLNGQTGTIPFPNDWDLSDNSNYAVSVNKTSRAVKLTYTNEQSSTMNMSLYEARADGDVLINQTSLTGTAGTLTLNIPLVYGNNSFYVIVYENGEQIKTYFFNLTPKNWEVFGSLGLFLSILIIICIAFIALSDGVIAIILSIVSLFLIGILGLVNLNYTALIYIACVGGIIIWKITKSKKQ